MSVETVVSRLHEHAKQQATAPAYYEKVNGQWQAQNWATYCQQVRQAAKAMCALGLKAGGTVGILGFNRPEWVIFDVACMLAGGAPAGIYTTNSPEEIEYIAHHAEMHLILLEDNHQLQKIQKVRANLPDLQNVVLMRGTPSPEGSFVLSWDEFMAQGDQISDEEIDARLSALTLEQTGTLIYTSGTTGPPKAVMLSHKNLIWTANTVARDLFGVDHSDSCLSYLPLSHIAEQMFSVHAALSLGYPVYYAESPEKIADNLKEVQPTLLFGVPRVWERFYNGINERLGQATGLRANLVAWARGVGKQVTTLRNQGQEPGGLLALQYKLADRLVFSKLKQALGMSRTKICASGAAPISPEILAFFGEFDIIVHEVYGQSEGSGPTTFNHKGKTRFGTVGPAIPGVDVKITEEGEVIAKGNNIFQGYYKDPEATAKTLKDAWLYSGDLGEFDADGFLTITGRKKDIIITSGGKNIAPKNIEAALSNIVLVAQSIVIGEGRRHLSALITLEETTLQGFAEAKQLSLENIHLNPILLDFIQKEIDQVNQRFARVEHIRRFHILPRNFSVEDGELTPTLKLKRNVVLEKYAPEIDQMYN